MLAKSRSFGASVVVAGLIGTLVAVSGVPSAPVAASPVATPFAMTTFRSSAVDPATGRVFVAGDDEVVVFNADGTLRATITGLPGAAGTAVAGGDLWVAETGAGAAARVDIASSTVAATYAAGPVTGSIAVDGAGLVWLTVPSGTTSGNTGLASLDPGTGAVTARGGDYPGASLHAVPGAADRLVVGVRSPAVLQLVDTSGPAIATVATAGSDLGDTLEDVAVTADGRRLAVASSPGFGHAEFDVATMTPTGVLYPSAVYASDTIAYSPGRGGVYVADVQRPFGQLLAYAGGRPVAAGSFTPSGAVLPRSVEVAADASRAYSVVHTTSAGTLALDRYDLTPAVSSVDASTAVAGVPSAVHVAGANLGATAGVTLGGVGAGFTVTGPGTLDIDVPASLAAGSYPLVLTGALGAATATATLAPDTGATLAGSVGGDRIQLTLSGPGLGTPRTTTSVGLGGYSFTGVPYGTHYVLDVHDQRGLFPDNQISGIALVPNGTTTLNPWLDHPAYPSPVTSVPLPVGSRDVEVDPGTDRVFVSVGDQVRVFDHDGAPLATLNDQFGASGLAVGGGSVWVNQSTGGRISRIDPVALAVTGTWPTIVATTGSVAYASGRVVFTDGPIEPMHLAMLDPSTGAVQRGGGDPLAAAYLGGVAGAPDRALLSSRYTETASLADTTTYPPAIVASGGGTRGTVSDWVASATSDRAWNSGGDEFRLSTMTSTGRTFTTGGSTRDPSDAVAWTPGMGGLVAAGAVLSVETSATATYVLDRAAPKSLALSTAGDRAYLVKGQTFEAFDLRPVATAVSDRTGGVLDVWGFGLGAATQVTVDGSPVAFTPLAPVGVHVTARADLPGGWHQVVVTTPWGRSNGLWFSTPPGAPTGVTATAGDGSATVAWSAPASSGIGIMNYEVVASGGAGSCTTAALTCTVSGLANGTSYTFTVRAANSAGFGPYSSPSDAVTPATVPGAPTGVTATAGDGSAIVAWSAPASNGGSAITSYEVVASGGAGSCTTAGALKCTLGGLANGTSYTFTVRAGNSIGFGPYSSPSDAVTPATVPGAPTGVSATPGEASATVSWSAPAADGGAAVQGYVVTAVNTGSSCTTSTLTCTLTGLTNGTAYTFTVSAFNRVGTGPSSAPSAAVTPATVPDAPSAVTVVAGKNEAAVTWTAPSGDGGAPVLGYEVASSPASAGCSTTGAFTCTVGGLSGGTAYTFQVRARNRVGWGPWSAPSAPATPKGPKIRR